ncbi:MAG: hypothetical protein M1820_006989 [Bogoriella megaspora]|nr:MAG: hypothetical protein M1820_006989 [Bogoriella megaspora]
MYTEWRFEVAPLLGAADDAADVGVDGVAALPTLPEVVEVPLLEAVVETLAVEAGEFDVIVLDALVDVATEDSPVNGVTRLLGLLLVRGAVLVLALVGTDDAGPAELMLKVG